jgi:hypothetical protein
MKMTVVEVFLEESNLIRNRFDFLVDPSGSLSSNFSGWQGKYRAKRITGCFIPAKQYKNK